MSNNEQAWLASMEAGKQGFQGGRLADAVNAFAQATELAPQRVEGWINLGSALVEHADYKTAAQVLDRAISLNPGIMVTHMIQGDAARMLGLRDKAVACYEKAVSLERAPMALNRLACMYLSMRRADEAEVLLDEALQLDPNFSLARVNRAGLLIEQHKFEQARDQLDALAGLPLPPPEKKEVDNNRTALAEYFRLGEAIEDLAAHDNQARLEEMIRQTPIDRLDIDTAALRTLEAYAVDAVDLAPPSTPAVAELPGDWALIEALFMIPMVDSVEGYQALKTAIKGNSAPSTDLMESLNMESVIHACRASKDSFNDASAMELHLRRWHALACRGIEGFMPGHYKYTQNWTVRSPTLSRVNPALVSGTLRYVFTDLYPKIPAGLPRAAFAYLVLADLHPFADGNGRLAMVWMNRELEWAGEMPALLTNTGGIKRDFGEATKAVRENGGDLSPLLAVIGRAQDFAQAFCRELG